MGIRKKVNLIIYRFRERGLEVFLVNDDKDKNNWGIPTGELDNTNKTGMVEEDMMIELDPVKHNNKEEEAIAVEGEWHDIPSLKSMLYDDAMSIKNKLFPTEKGTYFVVKEAFKKVLPHQYEFLKELKDVLTDRNSIKDL